MSCVPQPINLIDMSENHVIPPLNRRALLWSGIILAAAMAISVITHLPSLDRPDPTMVPWTGHVIFGLYFVVLAFVIPAVRPIHESLGPRPKQALVLIVLIGLCLDLVLVNVIEVTSAEKTAKMSYGLRVLWDLITFFVWLRVVDLCRGDAVHQFDSSVLVRLAPFFKLGREILLIPYGPDSIRDYLDLLFGDAAVCFLVFLPSNQGSGNRIWHWLKFPVFTGCVYWAMNALENTALLAFPPFRPESNAASDARWWLNCSYFVISIAAVVFVYHTNFCNLGSYIGLFRRPRSEQGRQASDTHEIVSPAHGERK